MAALALMVGVALPMPPLTLPPISTAPGSAHALVLDGGGVIGGVVGGIEVRQVGYQGEEYRRLDTRYFAIYYPPGEEQTARWYADFVDDVNVSVSELLGAEPLEGITLRIFSSEPDYIRANPLAQVHPVVAHAIPERMEIGVAVERLRQLPPEVARQSFRHEVTHVVAGALSNHNLPIGFQEGLGQYNELSTERGQDVAEALRSADAAGVPLLSWEDLNDLRRFRRRIAIAYPQSYTVMSFLAERYGMGAFGRFLAGLRDGTDYRQALQAAYGRTIEELQRQWHDEYLPGFLKDGWQVNVLAAYDMQPALDLYAAGRFEQAAGLFARSERLYRDVGRAERAAQASAYRAKAERAAQALELAAQARQALERHDYAAAHQAASSAEETFGALELAQHRRHAATTAHLAAQGLEAQAALQRARHNLRLLNVPGAYADAHRAAQAFALLGDAQRVAEANALLADLWRWQRWLGLSVIGGGVALLVAGALGVARTRARVRSRSRDQGRDPTHMREESMSWL
jgi:hypothetical protein